MAVVTCHTEECANRDVEITLELMFTDPATGETSHVDSVQCGVCGNEITDVKE